MAASESGGGRLLSTSFLKAQRAALRLDLPAAIDLNQATISQLSDHAYIGKRLAKMIVALRRQKIRTPADLAHRRLLTPAQLKQLSQTAFGSHPVRPLILGVSASPMRVYAGENFAVRVDFLRDAMVLPEILSLEVRFPSGVIRHGHFRITRQHLSNGNIKVRGLKSGEAGDLVVLAKLRDSEGGVHERSAEIGVFTHNPVHMYITPQFWTQSGSVGAPKYDFDDDKFFCHADVRWVNSESHVVNLGRQVTVRMTDAGTGHIATFSFNLRSDVIIPANSTVYGTLYTSHGNSSGAYSEFMARGDLTYRYSMSGSGFTPTRHQVWRAMRVVGYNIIRVGDFTAAERSEYRRAGAEIASNIYRSRDMTVHDVELYRIEGTPEMDADKARWRFIDNANERSDLRAKYRVDNWFLDVFFVEGIWNGAFGSSPVNGPSNKSGDSSGLVIRRDTDTVNLGQTFAHEGGHYLGLEHADEADGCDDTDPSDPNISDNFIFSASRRDSDVITGCQINTMRRHGLVRVLTP